MSKQLQNLRKNRTALLVIGVAIVISVAVVFSNLQQSIISTSNFSINPKNGDEIEGFNAKTVAVTISTIKIDFGEYRVAGLSFYVRNSEETWQSETFEGTATLVRGTVTVPDNGGYVIVFTVRIFFFEEKYYSTEDHTSSFGVFDPAYAGQEDEEFYTSEAEYNPYTDIDKDTIPSFEFPVLIAGLFVIYKIKKDDKDV